EIRRIPPTRRGITPMTIQVVVDMVAPWGVPRGRLLGDRHQSRRRQHHSASMVAEASRGAAVVDSGLPGAYAPMRRVGGAIRAFTPVFDELLARTRTPASPVACGWWPSATNAEACGAPQNATCLSTLARGTSA